MQKHYWALGVVSILVLGGAFLFFAQGTLAQTPSTTPASIQVGGKAYTPVSAYTDARPYLQILNSAGTQGFLFQENSDPQNVKNYALIETTSNEGLVHQLIGTQWILLDCEQSWYTFAASDLDFSEYVTYSSSISFSNIRSQECQANSNEGVGEPSDWIEALDAGQRAVQQNSVTLTQPTQPGSTPITAPSQVSTGVQNNASVPGPMEVCDIGSGPVQYIEMEDSKTGGDGLGSEDIYADDTGTYAVQPRNIIFTDAQGASKYLLQVWHFSSNEYIAESFISRVETSNAMAWNVIRHLAGQALDSSTIGLAFGIDVGHPIDAARQSIASYNNTFSSKSKTLPSGQVNVLPGIGKLSTGMRLCVYEDGVPNSYWGQIYHEKMTAFPINPLPSWGTLGSLPYQATFLSPQKGIVKIGYGVNQTTTPGTTDSIVSFSIDATAVPDNSVFRFRLSDATLTQLKNANTTFSDPNADGNPNDALSLGQIQARMSAIIENKTTKKKWEIPSTLTRLEGTLFENSATIPYLTTAPILEPDTGRPTEIDLSNPIYSGDYELTLKMNGFRDYKTIISLTPEKLSRAQTLSVSEPDIFKLDIKDMKWERNCANTCSNFGMCLACLASGVVDHYSSTTLK